jgi:hypothetical protein
MVLGLAGLGEARNSFREMIVTGAAHAVGGTVGGAGAVASLWMVATPIRTLAPQVVPVALLAALAFAAALSDAGRITLPRQRRQVPQAWLRNYGPARAYASYGCWLGAGLLTNISYMVEVVVLAAAALLLPFPEALLVGGIFGLGRTAPVTPLGTSRGLTVWWIRLYRGSDPGTLYASAILSVVVAVIAVAGIV